MKMISLRNEVSVPVQVHSAAEYAEMLQRAGWVDVQREEFVIDEEPGGGKPKAHARTLILGARKPGS